MARNRESAYVTLRDRSELCFVVTAETGSSAIFHHMADERETVRNILAETIPEFPEFVSSISTRTSAIAERKFSHP